MIFMEFKIKIKINRKFKKLKRVINIEIYNSFNNIFLILKYFLILQKFLFPNLLKVENKYYVE